jgi:ubiquinone/menaquinone biosynthesis C-methylase UbiE
MSFDAAAQACVPVRKDHPRARVNQHGCGRRMDESEFDGFADEYEAMHKAILAMSGEDADFFAEYKIRDIAQEYSRYPRSGSMSAKVLDFGSGNGGTVPYVDQYIPGAHLTCVDVSRRSLTLAEKRFPALAQYIHFDGMHLPFPADHFDIAYAACVFHHIDHAEHVSLLKELRRILQPGGCLFVFEHNPYNPLTMHVVNRCAFDKNARLIRGAAMKKRLVAAGFNSTRIRYRIFFPHVLRAMRPLEAALTWLPLGAQYCALARK